MASNIKTSETTLPHFLGFKLGNVVAFPQILSTALFFEKWMVWGLITNVFGFVDYLNIPEVGKAFQISPHVKCNYISGQTVMFINSLSREVTNVDVYALLACLEMSLDINGVDNYSILETVPKFKGNLSFKQPSKKSVKKAKIDAREKFKNLKRITSLTDDEDDPLELEPKEKISKITASVVEDDVPEPKEKITTSLEQQQQSITDFFRPSSVVKLDLEWNERGEPIVNLPQLQLPAPQLSPKSSDTLYNVLKQVEIDGAINPSSVTKMTEIELQGEIEISSDRECILGPKSIEEEEEEIDYEYNYKICGRGITLTEESVDMPNLIKEERTLTKQEQTDVDEILNCSFSEFNFNSPMASFEKEDNDSAAEETDPLKEDQTEKPTNSLLLQTPRTQPFYSSTPTKSVRD